jgi:hypothetical protein
MAIPTTPPCTFGATTVEPSGVDAEIPTASPEEGGSPASRERAAAAS